MYLKCGYRHGHLLDLPVNDSVQVEYVESNTLVKFKQHIFYETSIAATEC
jgi:hypothetical protein